MERIIKDNLAKIYEANSVQYNIDKTIEELQELSLILMQLRNKPHKVKNSDIIKEIADVEIRLPFIREFFGKKAIKIAIKKKINLILK